MLFSKQIPLTYGKTEATLTSIPMKIRRGVIWRVWMTFPAGCAGLVKCRLMIDQHPFLPVHKDAYLRGDDITFEFPITFEVKVDPAIVTFEGWNEDDTYNHTIDLYILVLDKAYVLPVGATEGMLESLKSLVIRPLVILQQEPGA